MPAQASKNITPHPWSSSGSSVIGLSASTPRSTVSPPEGTNKDSWSRRTLCTRFILVPRGVAWCKAKESGLAAAGNELLEPFDAVLWAGRPGEEGANAIADALKDEFPHLLIDTLAYQWSRKPPTCAAGASCHSPAAPLISIAAAQ